MITSANENGINEYIKLIDNCKMIDTRAKAILSKYPTAWARIATTAFDFTVKGKRSSVDAFNTYIANCTFIKFLEILENNKITLVVNENAFAFIGTGDLEEILLDSLFPY